MIGLIFIQFIGVIMATAALLFGILAYNRKENVFFWLGIGFNVFVTLGIVLNAEYYFSGVTEYQDIYSIMTIGAWIISVLFLALAKINNKPNDDAITDAFLDGVINSEDEEWDAES